MTKYHNFGAFLNLGEKKKELVKLTAAVITLLCLLLFIVTLGRHGKRPVSYTHLDLYYIENWTMGLDIKILFLTIFKGFVNKNAY